MLTRQHVMKSGPRKGQNCGKSNWMVDYCEVDYCFDHYKKYKDVWGPLVAQRKVEKANRQSEERKKFEDKLEPRLMDYKWVIANSREYFNFMDQPAEKTEDTIIEAVDRIIMAGISAHRMMDGSYFTILGFKLWPSLKNAVIDRQWLKAVRRENIFMSNPYIMSNVSTKC